MTGKKRAERGSKQRGNQGNPAAKKAARGSTRAHRTESVRGRKTSDRRAA